jgi:predicted RNA-binding Zn-ribbon protein involved in translation (DUF1610 family)|tara:strand:+ start:143 stop:391 length:249 start_codon:yes stop_codon:yes gene_type:complete
LEIIMPKKNQTRYRCPDCNEVVFLNTMSLNRRNGDRCMNCGGRLQPDSSGADERLQLGADHQNEPDRASIRNVKTQRSCLRK